MHQSELPADEFERFVEESLLRRADLAEPVSVPQFQSLHPDAPGRNGVRRTAIAVAIAAALLTATVWLLPGDADEATVVVADQEAGNDAVVGAPFLAAWLPDGIEGPSSLSYMRADEPELPGAFVEPHRVFRREIRSTGDNGVSVSFVLTSIEVIQLPDEVMPPDANAERIQVGSRDAIVRRDPPEMTVSVALQPGVTLSLWSRSPSLDVADLEPLIEAISPDSGDVVKQRLPAQWAEVPGSGPIVAGAVRSSSPRGAPITIASFEDPDATPQRAAFLHVIEHPDPGGALKIAEAMLDAHWATGVSDPSATFLMRAPEGSRPSHGTTNALWTLDDTHIGYLFGVGLDEAEVVRMAESVERVPDAEWSQLVATVGLETEASLRARRELPFDDLIATGTLGEYRWEVGQSSPGATGRPDELGRSDPADWVADLRVTAANGETTARSIQTVSSGTAMVGWGRDPLVLIAETSTPPEIVGHSLSYLGQDLPTAVVRLSDSQPTFVFAILPARETGDIADGDLQLEATFPDGTPYDVNDPFGLNASNE